MIMITNMFNVLEVEKPNGSLGSQTTETVKDYFHDNHDYDYYDHELCSKRKYIISSHKYI